MNLCIPLHLNCCCSFFHYLLLFTFLMNSSRQKQHQRGVCALTRGWPCFSFINMTPSGISTKAGVNIIHFLTLSGSLRNVAHAVLAVCWQSVHHPRPWIWVLASTSKCTCRWIQIIPQIFLHNDAHQSSPGMITKQWRILSHQGSPRLQMVSGPSRRSLKRRRAQGVIFAWSGEVFGKDAAGRGGWWSWCSSLWCLGNLFCFMTDE